MSQRIDIADTLRKLVEAAAYNSDIGPAHTAHVLKIADVIERFQASQDSSAGIMDAVELLDLLGGAGA